MKNSVRAIFMHNDYLADLILTLKFDRYLLPQPNHTVIFYGPHGPFPEYKNILELHGIHCRNIEFMPDWYLWNNDKLGVDIYQFEGWITQQIIKLMAIDHLSTLYDYILVQDCDTFNIKPYHWITDNNVLQMYGLPNTGHPEIYERYVEIFTGYPRQTSDCFVTEFMPLKSQSWVLLKQQICLDQTNWITHICEIFSKDWSEQKRPVSEKHIDFSEYEVLGNWNLLVDKPINIIEQKRFELRRNSWRNRLDEIKVCNVIANFRSLTIDETDYWSEHFLNFID